MNSSQCLRGVQCLADTMAHRWRQPFIEGVLTREELEQYWTEGYVVKNDLLEKQQLDSVRTAVARYARVSTHLCNIATAIVLSPK